MSSADVPVALLGWNEDPERTIQDVEWKLEDRSGSTNRVEVTTSLEEADGVDTGQELIFKNRRFTLVDGDRERADDEALIEADEVQAELADIFLVEFKANSWTLEQAVEVALEGTRWSIGTLQGIRFGRADFEDISVMDTLKFLTRHQDAYLSFDSLRRRVNITQNHGTTHEVVFTYGRQLKNIKKEETAPVTTVIYATGAEGLTVAEVNDGVPYVEDYGYYTSRGLSLEQSRARHRKEDYWSDDRYTVAENLLRDCQKRLEEEAYPAITYTLTAAATTAVDAADDFDLGDLRLGDKVYVWDQEIDARLQAEVTAVTTSSDASENKLTLSTLPSSLGSGETSDRYFGDSGSPSRSERGRSVPQPRPSMPILEEVNRVGGGVLRWNGQDENGDSDTIPRQFGTIETRVAKLIDGAIPSPDSDDAFSGTSISERGGGVASVSFGGGGEFAVWFYMVGRDGRTRSEYSEPLTVEVEELVDTDAMREELDLAEERLDGLDGIMEGYDENIGNLNLDLESLGEFLENGDVDADNWSVGGRIMGRDIIGQTFAGAAAAFIRVDTENLVAGAVQTRHMAIADFENLLGDDALWTFREEGLDALNWRSGAGGAAGWETSVDQSQGPVVLRYQAGDHPSGTNSALRFTPTGSGVPVKPGDSFYIEADAWVNSGSAGYLKLRARYTDENGNSVSWHDIGEITTGGFEYEWTVPDNPSRRRMDLGFWADDGGTGNAQIGTFRFRRKHGAELLVDGSITTRKLFITEEMVAELGKFLKIKVGELGANEIEGMSIIGGTIEGTVMRGNLFETTADPERGIKIDDNNFRAWDSNNNLRTQVSASSGNLTATGMIRTEFTGNRIELYDDGDGGNIRFISGSATGSIKSRESAGRLSMVYNDTTGSDADRPFVGVEQDRALLQYRSQRIMVGGTSSSNQYMLFDSDRAQFQFDVLLRQGGRTQYTRSSDGTLGHSVGYIGQRPEAGNTPVMEIRGEGNTVRISGASEFTVQRVYDDTTTLDANVRVGSTGHIRRATSATKYKVDPRELEVPDTILDVELHEWVDRAELERWADIEGNPRPFTQDDQWDYDGIDLSRTSGVLAEHVAELGGKHFVEYGMSGDLEEVNYTRLALAQIQVVKRKIQAQDKRIATLEAAL